MARDTALFSLMRARRADEALTHFARFTNVLSPLRAVCEALHMAAACTSGPQTQAATGKAVIELMAALQAVELAARTLPRAYSDRAGLKWLIEYSSDLRRLAADYATAAEHPDERQAALRDYIAAQFLEYGQWVNDVPRKMAHRPPGMSEDRRLLAEELKRRDGTAGTKVAAIRAEWGVQDKRGQWVERDGLTDEQKAIFKAATAIKTARVDRAVSQLLAEYDAQGPLNELAVM